jgi:hypothetical protein
VLCGRLRKLGVGDTDPHIHVDVRFHADVASRERIAATFGLVADVPATVTTGCDLRVPLVMTSSHPEQVTCLACREFAHREHLRLAEQIERLGRMPGSMITPDQVSAVAARHRDAATKFAP